MNRIDYRKYKGVGRPRRSDYRQSLSPFEHEKYQSHSFDWTIALVAGLMVLTAIFAIAFNELGITDAFINSFN